MNSSYPSFISENSNRSFPFVENSISSSIPNDCFIDIRGWSRFKTTRNPSLFLVAKNTPSVQPSYDQFFKEGFLHLLFSMHEVPEGEQLFNGLVCVYVPLDNTEWPYLGVSSFWNSAGTKMFELRVLLNSSILDVIPGESGHLFPVNEMDTTENTGLRIEPTQIVYSGGIAIDELNIVKESGESKRQVSGDLKLIPGYNCSMRQDGNKIVINSSIDIGTGKRYNDQKNDVCTGVFSINGVSPDESGHFYITGENGILIFDVPEEYKIVIAIDPKTKVVKCPI